MTRDHAGEIALLEVSRYQLETFRRMMEGRMDNSAWLHIAFAPKDGSWVRVKSDTGFVYEANYRNGFWFTESGNMLSDDDFCGQLAPESAVQWQAIS